MDWLLHVDTVNVVLARRGHVTAALLLLAEMVVLGLFFVQLGGRTSVLLTLARLAISTTILTALFVANRRGLVSQAGVIFSVFLVAANFLLFDLSGESLPGPAILIVPVLLAGLLAPPGWAFGVVLLAIAAHLWLLLWLNRLPMSDLDPAALLGVYGNLLVTAFAAWMFSLITSRSMEEGARTSASLAYQQRMLEERAATQSRYLQATISIARAIVGARDIDRLLEEGVRLIRDTFGYYHVQIFLIDEAHEYAVLRSSTGEAGEKLLAQGHRLPVGSLSVIGQVTANGRSVIARDTDLDAVHKRNELLPFTRSEMALPIMAGSEVVGALDLQSIEPHAFHEDVVPTLQALTDQLGIAIENARLYAQTQSSLRELEELYGEVTERSWSEFLAAAREQEKRGVYGPEPSALQVQRSSVVQKVLGAGSVIMATGVDGRQSFLAAPVVVRGEVVGVLGVEPDGVREWTQDDFQLIQSIAERTALAVENARLYLQAQRAADRERLVNTIAARLQRAPTLSLLLESATQELAHALGTDNVYAEISLNQPLAQSRREVTDLQAEAVEGAAKPAEGSTSPLDPDTPEEARAK